MVLCYDRTDGVDFNFETLTLSDAGSWSSIFGILFSLYISVAVFSIKTRFRLGLRLDEHKEKLTEIYSFVIGSLNGGSFEMHEIKEKFLIANIELRCIQKGASGDLLKEVKAARKSIKYFILRSKFESFRLFSPTKTNIRNTNTKILLVVEELDNFKREYETGN